MLDLKFRETGPLLTLAEIAEFEEEINGRLPDDYNRFLLKSNLND